MHVTPKVAIHDGTGHDGITGRDAFERLKEQDLAMSRITDIRLGRS